LDDERYLMSAVAVARGDPERPILRDEVPRTLAEVESTLDERVLPYVPEAVGGDVEGLVLEFVVPDRLLGLPVEDWRFDRAFPRPLGIRYPVVVRSLDRMRDPRSHDIWRRKTRRLQEYGQVADTAAVHHVTRDARTTPASPDEPLEVYAKIFEADDVAVLSVPFPPHEQAAEGEPTLFTAATSAGLPVVVWTREQTDPAWLRTQVESHLLAEGPANLPRQVLKYRLARRGTARGTRPALGLLFDEATQIPNQVRPRHRLRPPGSAHVTGGGSAEPDPQEGDDQ
jgi:hypothetical protein